MDFAEIQNLLPWGEPRLIATKNGGMTPARTCFPTAAFWDIWRDRRDELVAAGVKPWKSDKTGQWRVYWWLPAGAETEGLKDIPVDTSVLSPAIKAKLRDFQIEKTAHGVNCLSQDGVWAYLNAWDGGLGKTYAGIATGLSLGRKMIVLCRKSAITAWLRVAVGHFGMAQEDITVINPEKVRTGKTPLGKWMAVEGSKKEVFRWAPEVKDHLLIFDEVHGYGGVDTKNSLLLTAVRDQQMKALCLSATAASTPIRLYALGYVLGLHNAEDFYPWVYGLGCTNGDYGLQFTCGLTWGQILHEQGGQEELEKRQNHVMKVISDRIFKNGKGSRISKADIPGFPECQVIPVGLDFQETKKINAIYDEMIDELAGLKSLSDPRAKESMIRARQKTELLKIPDIVTEVEAGIEEGFSVPVFVSFRASVFALQERLNTECIIVGGQSRTERDNWIDRFQADKERTIITNIQAGGESISLHDLHGRFPRMSLISPSFWAESVLQALYRIHRDGARSKALQKILFAMGTIEEDAYTNFVSKLSRMNAFNEGTIITDADLTGRLNKLLNK